MIKNQQNQQEPIGLIQKCEAINLIKTAAPKTTIIIDFDETLFLRNSTAEYLNSLKPRLIGLLIVKILYFLRPWNCLPKPFKGAKVEDWFLVTCSTILLPWTWFIWQHKAKKLAKDHGNAELIDAINHSPQASIVVATLGFNFIVNPILNCLPIKYDQVIGCGFWQGARDRSQGKLLMLKKLLSAEAIKSAIAITDSYDDMPILQEVEKPCLVIWPSAKYVAPLKDVYLPFFYLDKVKRVGENYIFKVILWDDLPILIFAFSWQANHHLWHGISMMLLLVSFWCVYEIGYYENDRVAEKYEENPKLSITYHSYKHTMDTRYPWLWSLVFGFLGVALLVKGEDITLLFSISSIEDKFNAFNSNLLPFIYWIGFLLLSRLCFWVYNHLNKHTRTWLYLLLQSFRYYGFIAITSTNFIGTSLLSSQILSRSILYVVYRYSVGDKNGDKNGDKDSWPKQVPEKLLRWLMFMFILAAIAIGSRNLALWENWQTWTIIAWCMIQGKGQFLRAVAEVKPIVKDGSNKVASIANS